MPPKSNENRLEILKAAQNGKLAEIIQLLNSVPTLLQVKTSTAGSSLLHIAAEYGYEDVCRALLERGHETNPLDHNGRTPYQRSKSEAIKSLLRTKHCDYLFNKHFSARLLAKSNFPHINSVSVSYAVLSLSDFFAFFRIRGLDAANVATKFAVTVIQHKTNRLMNEKLDYKLLVYFREDFLMQPYYGELLVIHENEQATQLFELLQQGVFDLVSVSRQEKNRFETRSYLTIIARALVMFPFLREYPLETDAPAVKEAKKLFIRFTLCDFVLFYQQCNLQQLAYLERLVDYDDVTEFVEKMISAQNNARYRAISAEMTEKYITSNLALAEASVPVVESETAEATNSNNLEL